MKESVESYMNKNYEIKFRRDKAEGGYTVWIPDLPGCITCCESADEIESSIDDAKLSWITAEIEEGHEIPLPRDIDDYSGQFKLRMPKSLHKKLAERAREEGVSLNHYCVYLLSR